MPRRPARYSHASLRDAFLIDAENQPLVRVRRGARDLLGIEPTMEAVHERLERYSLAQVLTLLGRINAVLRDVATPPRDVQELLLHALFPRDVIAGMHRRLHHIRASAAVESPHREQELVAFFDPRLVTSMTILAGTVLPPDAAQTWEPPQALGEALLMLSDLEGPLAPKNVDMDMPEGRRAWAYYFAVGAFLHGADPSAEALVRAVDIFLAPHDELGAPDAVDLASAFEERTGLSLDAYTLVAITLIGTMLGITAQTVHERQPVIPPDFFSGLGSEVRERFLNLVSVDAATFCQRARASWPAGATRPRDFLAVEASPLVRTQYGAVCVAVQELERRLTVGLYHDLLNARREPGARTSKFGAAVQREVGRRFQRYVDGASRRMVERLRARSGWHPKERRDGGPARYITDAELAAAAQGGGRTTPSTCDGALVVGHDLLLIECKARFFELAARSGQSEDAFFGRLDEITLGGIRQIEATLDHLAAGRLRSLGLAPGRVRRVFPVVVSLDPIPLTHYLRAWIDERLETAGLSQQSHVSSITVHAPEFFAARDFEWLETVVEHTTERPGEVIAQKQATAFGYAVSLASWAAIDAAAPRIGRARATYCETRWEELGDRARAFFRKHSQRPASEPG